MPQEYTPVLDNNNQSEVQESMSIYRNAVGNLVTNINGVQFILQTLPETHEDRIKYNVHATVVFYLNTPLGELVHRGVEVCWSDKYANFYVRFFRKKTRDMNPDGREFSKRLDVCGPRTQGDRRVWEQAILAFFQQAQQQVAAKVEFPSSSHMS